MVKAILYLNQFYAGIGGEKEADYPLTVLDDVPPLGKQLESLSGAELKIIKTIVCGDNTANNEALVGKNNEKIKKILQENPCDVAIGAPAFNAGRYGVASASFCYQAIQLGIPAVTAMWRDNPAIPIYASKVHILKTRETSVGMRDILPKLSNFAVRLAKGEPIKAARLEDYYPTGLRRNEYHDRTGAQRVVDMLIAKLQGQEIITEIPLRTIEGVKPTDPIKDIRSEKIALITTGGLVPKGNPDGLKQAFSTDFGTYSMEGLDVLSSADFESIHGGYDTTFASADPHRLVPLDALRSLEKKGEIAGVYPYFFTTCGVGTNIKSSENMGERIAAQLKKDHIRAAIITST